MKAPKLRFSGFTEAWEQRKLGEIVNYRSSHLSTTDIKINGKYDLYDVNEVIGKTDIEPIDTEYISIIKDGAGVGRIKVLPQNTMIIGTMGAIQAVNSNLYFIYALLTKFDLSKYATGSTIPHIYFKDYRNNEYSVCLLEEQTKIGTLFSLLDQLITLNQRKYEQLQKLKKFLLQKLFPRKSELSPELRFDGFTDDWKQRKLREIVNYRSSHLSTTDIKINGKYDLYDANEVIGKTDIEPIDTEYISIIKDGAGVGRIKVLPQNTMIIGTMGAIQAVNSNLYFIYALLTKFDLSKYATGSTIPHIYFKDYGNNEYSVCLLEEQTKIGTLFSHLDHLITLHQRKCEQLQKFKQFMLQNMFV